MVTASFILIIFFLIFWSAYFSGSEIALFSLPSTKIKAYQNNKDFRKRLIAKLVLRPRDLLVTIFIMNTLVNILLQNVTSTMFGATSSLILKVGVPLFFTLILGEIIPKYVALQLNVPFSYRVAPFINFLTNFLRPIREWIVKITSPISRVMFFFLKKEDTISKEELQHVLKTSQEFGVLHADEAELIYGYLNLQDSQAKELMWPKEDVLYYNIHDPLSKLIYLFVDEHCTRLPVCDKDIDSVLGILSADQFFIHRPEIKKPEDLIGILKKPFFIPETTPTRLLFRRFNEKNEVIGLVINEYGVISGLIAKEDLVEEVIGEISDRRDKIPLYTKAGKDVIITSGKLELSEFEDIFGIALESPNNMLTIGGWLTEQLGEIPKSGTKYETQDFLFQVLAAEPNRVKSIYIRKKHKKAKTS